MLYLMLIVLMLPIATAASDDMSMEKMLKKFSAMEDRMENLQMENVKLKNDIEALKAPGKLALTR